MNLLIPGAAPAPTPDEQTFSALELALRGPDKEQAGLRAVAAIQALEQRVRQRCAQGLPPDEFDQARRVLDACTAAQETPIMLPTPNAPGSIPEV